MYNRPITTKLINDNRHYVFTNLKQGNREVPAPALQHFQLMPVGFGYYS